MADDGAPASPPTEGKSGTFGFLTRKLGPMPVWMWGAIIVGIYYWYKNYGPGKSSSAAAGSPTAAGASTIVVAGGGGNADVDSDHGGGGPPGGHPPPPKTGGGGQWKSITIPSDWNGWSLDRIAKYLHWTPETKQDVIAANARGGKHITGSTTFHTGESLLRPVAGGEDTSKGPGEAAAPEGRPGAGTANANVPATGVRDVAGNPAPAGALGIYQLPPQGNATGTATGWEAAAINYLIGEGVPPDESSTSVWAYLHQQPLSSRMQANVNLASDGIGPPPNVPGPATVVRNVPQRNTPRKVGASA